MGAAAEGSVKGGECTTYRAWHVGGAQPQHRACLWGLPWLGPGSASVPEAKKK